MIQDMKKLTFLVTNQEYDRFIADIRQLGIVHVEELQHGATSDELKAGLDLAERYKNALKALDYAAETYESSATYTPQPADASKGVPLVDTVERLLDEENSVKHGLDAAEDAIRQLEPFGEFSWDSIRQLVTHLSHIAGRRIVPNYAAPRPGDIYRSMLDNLRAFRGLGWKPETGLEEALRRTYEHFTE